MMTNTASTYSALGRHAEALVLNEQALLQTTREAQATAESRIGCIFVNLFNVEQEGWRLNGFYEPTEER